MLDSEIAVTAFIAGSLLPSGIELWQMLILIGVTLVASIIRGYAGFGMSALLITTAALILEPRILVPVLYALETLATIQMLPGIIRHIDRRLVAGLMVGALTLLPIGQYLLLRLPPDAVRIFLACFVMLCAFGTLKGWRREMHPGIALGVGTGAIFGLGSGLASIGGLGAMLILMATHPDPRAARASAMCLFAMSSTVAFFLAFSNGLANSQTLHLLAILLAPMIIGVSIGGRMFAGTNIEVFKKRVLWVIIGLACCLLLSLAMRHSPA